MIEMLTALLVVVTTVYVYLTYLILRSTKDSVQAMDRQVSAIVRPYAHFDLSSAGPLINATLHNTGQSAAKNVQVSLTPELTGFSRDTPRPVKIASQTVTWLPPGKRIEEFVCSFAEMENTNPSMAYQGTIQYQDQSGVEYREHFVIDHSLRRGFHYINQREPQRELEGIRMELQKITSHSFCPLVRTITEEQYRQRNERRARQEAGRTGARGDSEDGEQSSADDIPSERPPS